jgi:hypothetical protein
MSDREAALFDLNDPDDLDEPDDSVVDDDESEQSGEQTPEPAEPVADVLRLLRGYQGAIQGGTQDAFWAGLSESEQVALKREGEAAPFVWDPESFTPPDPTKPDYEPDRIRRAEREAKTGLDAILRRRLVVSEPTRETALDLSQLAEGTTGRVRDEALLALENLVNQARLHAQSAQLFDPDHVISTRSWVDGGGRRHVAMVDHRGRRHESITSRVETQAAVEAQREARAERERLRVSSDASPELVEQIRKLESGSLPSPEDFASLPQADRATLMRKMSREQREQLRKAAESAAESQQRRR